MAVKERAVKEHIDTAWISERIGGHGGSFSYAKPDGIVRIRYIGGKPKIVIWFYNFLLLMRYCRRKIWRLYLKCMGAKY